MRYDEEREEYILSNGNIFSANCGIIGIGPNGTYEGYDGRIRSDDFTSEEKREVAEYMIAKWTEWSKQ